MRDMDTTLDDNLKIEIELELDEADALTNDKTKFQKLAQTSKNKSDNTKEMVDWGKPVGKEYW